MVKNWWETPTFSKYLLYLFIGYGIYPFLVITFVDNSKLILMVFLRWKEMEGKNFEKKMNIKVMGPERVNEF